MHPSVITRVGVALVAVLCFTANAAEEAELAGVPTLDEQVKALRDSGEPVAASDFKRGEPLPDDRNAARTLAKAAAMLHRPNGPVWSGRLSRQSIRDYQGELSGDLLAEIRQVSAAEQPTLAVIDTLADLNACDWGDPPGVPLALFRAGPPLNVYVVEISQLTFLDGLLGVHDRDRPRALRRVRALYAIAEAASRHLDASVSSYWRTIAGLAADLLCRIATADGFDVNALGGQAAIQEVAWRRLDAAPTREAFLHETRAERAAVIDASQRIAAGTLEPVQLKDTGYAVGNFTGMRIGVPMWPAAVALLTGATDVIAKQELSRSQGMAALRQSFEKLAESGVVARHVALTLGPTLSAKYDNVVELRGAEVLAAVATAVRLYRVDHADAFPPDLAALVPKYLPSVPADPTARMPMPIRYRAGGDAPMLWAAGHNGVDDGGQGPAEAGFRPERLKHADFVVWLRPGRVPAVRPN